MGTKSKHSSLSHNLTKFVRFCKIHFDCFVKYCGKCFARFIGVFSHSFSCDGHKLDQSLSVLEILFFKELRLMFQHLPMAALLGERS